MRFIQSECYTGLQVCKELPASGETIDLCVVMAYIDIFPHVSIFSHILMLHVLESIELVKDV